MGSNLLTDRMLSNNAFEIIHDGTGTNRVEKVRQINRWSETRQNLRVCWEGQSKDRNCFRCQKCVANILIIRAVGQGPIPAFPNNITDLEIHHLKLDDLTSIYWDIMLLVKANIPRSTLHSMKLSILINRVRLAAMRHAMLKWLVRRVGDRWFLDPADPGLWLQNR